MRTSEYVGLGHPDKTADYISEYILDRYLEADESVRYALEVQIKDNFVTLGGEITGKKLFSNQELEIFVRQAVNQIGYDKAYQKFWGKGNTICGDEIEVTCHISQQSPEISQGVNDNGWGDQGIFWGYAENNPEHNYMPKDHALARELAKELFDTKLGGLDIKTQITLNKHDEICQVIVAIPTKTQTQKANVAELIKTWVKKYPRTEDYSLIVNGTGEYIIHSSIGDCGITGRKLVVDFYGGNSKIGGGSPWTKDGTKADLTLNLMARKIAKANLVHNKDKVYSVKTSLACCIGRKEVYVTIKLQGYNGESKSYEVKASFAPSELIKEFALNSPIFAETYKNGLFYDKKRAWEKSDNLSKTFIKDF